MKDLLLVLLAIFLPPIAVYIKVGFAAHFWINILLCLFFVIPGSVHALIVVMTR